MEIENDLNLDYIVDNFNSDNEEEEEEIMINQQQQNIISQQQINAIYNINICIILDIYIIISKKNKF